MNKPESIRNEPDVPEVLPTAGGVGDQELGVGNIEAPTAPEAGEETALRRNQFDLSLLDRHRDVEIDQMTQNIRASLGEEGKTKTAREEAPFVVRMADGTEIAVNSEAFKSPEFSRQLFGHLPEGEHAALAESARQVAEVEELAYNRQFAIEEPVASRLAKRAALENALAATPEERGFFGRALGKAAEWFGGSNTRRRHAYASVLVAGLSVGAGMMPKEAEAGAGDFGGAIGRGIERGVRQVEQSTQSGASRGVYRSGKVIVADPVERVLGAAGNVYEENKRAEERAAQAYEQYERGVYQENRNSDIARRGAKNRYERAVEKIGDQTPEEARAQKLEHKARMMEIENRYAKRIAVARSDDDRALLEAKRDSELARAEAKFAKNSPQGQYDLAQREYQRELGNINSRTSDVSGQYHRDLARIERERQRQIDRHTDMGPLGNIIRRIGGF